MPMHHPEPGIRESKPAAPAPPATPPPTSAISEGPPPAASSAASPVASLAASPSASPSAAAVPPGRRFTVSSVVLLCLLLILTFFLASFAVSNADFWMHLGTGRLLAEGEYTFGEDPFSFMSDGPWINHSWLYDWGLYGLYQLAG